ncbi:RNA-binding protein POP5 [Gigaspora margarita]|uniref:RNA-binding protein POP5 n=1 Tax=Gigaspora margarita TaxID=4874 RepID=A0A8H4A7B6_GIGMA|nr:RNA-binding protein POP5 [Gigaspora margarita]
MVRLKHRWILFETLFENTSHQDTSNDPLTSHDIYITVKEFYSIKFWRLWAWMYFFFIECKVLFTTYKHWIITSVKRLLSYGTIKQCQKLVIEYDREQLLENEDLNDI